MKNMTMADHKDTAKKATYTLTHFPFAKRLYDYISSPWIDNRISERDALIRVKKCNFPDYIII